MANIEWQNIFLNDLNFSMVLEIGIRTLIMFILVLVFLRSTGKKGVRQLSIFEVAIIISLGSAAGDPMLNSESAILPSLLVFVVILGIYRGVTFWAAKSQRMENVLEGVPMYIVENGMFTLKEDSDSTFAKDEFFAEMRVQSIEHLGQVRTAILETNGQVSFLYYQDDQVRYGLPLFPKIYLKKSNEVSVEGVYACTHCGNIAKLTGPEECERCKKKEWVMAINTARLP